MCDLKTICGFKSNQWDKHSMTQWTATTRIKFWVDATEWTNEIGKNLVGFSNSPFLECKRFLGTDRSGRTVARKLPVGVPVIVTPDGYRWRNMSREQIQFLSTRDVVQRTLSHKYLVCLQNVAWKGVDCSPRNPDCPGIITDNHRNDRCNG